MSTGGRGDGRGLSSVGSMLGGSRTALAVVERVRPPLGRVAHSPGIRPHYRAVCARDDEFGHPVSDNWIRVIPIDPTFVPTAQAASTGRDLLDRLAPASATGSPAREVDLGAIVFVDAGSNFDSVACPWCGAAIDLDWWRDRMDAAVLSGFTDLLTRTRCCDVTTSLNDLRYDWPQGFARWSLEVMNPINHSLSDAEVASIGDAVGIAVRAIYVHY